MNGNATNPERAADGVGAWLGVNVLTEFVFCPRAGLIEFERERVDDGEDEDEPRANVNYMPPYEVEAIVRQIEQTTQALKRWLPVPVISLAVTVVAGWMTGWCPAVTGVFLTMCLTKPVFTALDRLRELKELYEYVQSRTPIEPDPTLTANQHINWWELLKAGFESFVPPRKLEDENMRFVGRPWRILRRGGMQIPVFKKRIDGLNPTTIYEQHYVRMAAYCDLLESGVGVRSPYGIVLFGHTFEGVALNAAAARNQFREGLLNARRVIAESKAGQLPSEAPPKKCWACPLGKPFVTRPSIAGSGLQSPALVQGIGADGRTYSSDCGNRFAWIPRHKKAIQKEIHKG